MSTTASPGVSPVPNSTPATNATSPPPPSPPTPSSPPPSNHSSPPPTTPSPSPPSPEKPPPSPAPESPPDSPPPPTTPSNPPPPTSPSNPPPNPATPSASPPLPASGKNPPAPVTRLSPPPSSPVPRDTPSASSSISTGVIAGIAAGVVGVILLCVLGICIMKRKKRRKSQYYPPPPPQGPKVDPYGRSPANWQNNAPPPSDHIISAVPPTPPHPPKTPPYINNSGGSSSNFSGGAYPLPPFSPGMGLSFSKSTFTYEELARATDGFSDANLLGQGGFGYVHKGVLPNGKEVAIKQLKAGSGQGEREFHAEIEIISRVHHKHLVSLVGYCTTGVQRLLVYEFVPNDTLEFHLHGKGQPTMDWSTRHRIALGAAKGLAYLHEDCHPKIIHRDIKAANILLDFKFEAMVADFGLAKFTSDVNTHVSTRVMGTFGYLAPEYAASGKLTDKSDVYSFGVMLLELITGRRPVDSSHTFQEDSLVDWARPVLTQTLEDENFDSLVDPRLQNEYDRNEMACMVACAAAAIRYSAKRRPKMSQIVRALEGDATLEDLNDGAKPGNSSAYGSRGNSDYDSAQYKKDMSKFRKLALETQEHGDASSEYNGVTSEYGLNTSESSGEIHNRQTTREMEMRKMKNNQGFKGSS
ncbi:hypothetical protein TanjilG_32757 [Lupinus angustifolius]|uniref:non-specific serine/threonine protein kinase n=1 Tax=Lupinus angustifolius TaxID=3871 RepID=A0A4P1RFV9_LUPAN|nr:PREDICTED: proline-rich receptor-like protein kinase PERK1 [Lupinus angustifolius]OIW10017.1 hypothetical protein TanjilG_32757 [Lupinus angustifolius]